MGSKAALHGGGAGAGDRLSSLEDSVLGHILSFLPAAEAARAAVLSRRWRHVLAAAHTLSFDEPAPPVPEQDSDDDSGYWSPGYGPSVRRVDVRPSPFVTAVWAALLARHRRGAAAAAPLRALRVVFDDFDARDYAPAVDGWLAHAAHQAGGELRLDLRLGRKPPPGCARAYALRSPGDGKDSGGGHRASPSGGPKESEYVVPRSLFSCAALRALRLGHCHLDPPPPAAALPSLDTMHLTRVTGRRDAVQRLVAGCPRLADLTLESCAGVAALSLPAARLRRLALRCCHGLAAVAGDLSELETFEYRGPVPRASFLATPVIPRRITSCTLDFCGKEATATAALAGLGGLLGVVAYTTCLSVKSARLGAGAGHDAFFSPAAGLPVFPNLRHLDLTGMVPTADADDADAAVGAVIRILERTPRLEALSLFFLPEPEPLEERRAAADFYYDAAALHALHRLRHDRHAAIAVPDDDAETPCLRETTREINLVHYQGGVAQRTLAKLLLRHAAAADEVCCVFAHGPLLVQTRLMEEMRGWVMNEATNMVFL
ncbi:hypothetical protein ACP4OV_002050 [Aristida adscensionis]